jgi:hypothetical protein
MRFGYSPGWGGIPPGAWQPGQMGPTHDPTGGTYGASPEEELDFLRNQVSALEQQMNQILKRIDEIEKAKEE